MHACGLEQPATLSTKLEDDNMIGYCDYAPKICYVDFFNLILVYQVAMLLCS